MTSALQFLFWGGYLGIATLLLAGSLLTYLLTRIRASLEFGVGVVVATLYIIVQLGWPTDLDVESHERLGATLGLAGAAFLGGLLSRLLRVERSERRLQRASYAVVVLGMVLMVVSLFMDARSALWLAAFGVTGCGALGILVCLLAAWYGDRLARLIALAAVCLTVGSAALAWIALNQGDVPSSVHGLTAVAASLYLSLLAWAAWLRHRYRVELRMALRNSQVYDPLTRLASSVGIAKVLAAALEHSVKSHTSVGVICISVPNLHALMGLHGPDFVNHALFVLASRLKVASAAGDTVGRFGKDGFMLVATRPHNIRRFYKRGPRMAAELRQPVNLGTANSPESSRLRIEWQAEVGVGVMLVQPGAYETGKVMSMGRSLAISALSFPGRVAAFDPTGQTITEFVSSSRR
ncbi:MAG: diguanylate cyclase [Burkholderiaceae bacterium]|nr:diguanylate cyclase [Burkholderiaceae bacterium]